MQTSAIGHVLAALAKTGRESITVIGTDHGGHDRHHGTEMAEDMTIPWIISGQAFRLERYLPKCEYTTQRRLSRSFSACRCQ